VVTCFEMREQVADDFQGGACLLLYESCRLENFNVLEPSQSHRKFLHFTIRCFDLFSERQYFYVDFVLNENS